MLLFNFQHFHTILCAFSGTTYYLAAIFALVAFKYMKSNHRSGFLLVLCASTLAVWTFGNGWLVFPILSVHYVLDKKWKNLFLILAVTTANAVVYFIGYHPDRLNSIDSFSIIGILEYTAIFLGNSFQFLYHPLIPYSAAAFISIVFLISSFKIFIKRESPDTVFYMLAFLIGSAIMAAVFRHQSGVEQAYSVRYGFFSLMAFWCAVLLLVRHYRLDLTKYGKKVMIGGAALLTLLKAILFYPEMAVAQEEYREMMKDWKRTGKEIEKHTPFYPRGIVRIMDQSEINGTWRFHGNDTLPPNNPMFTIQYIHEKNRWIDR
ncbi:MAG: hypothetical protein ACKOQ6_10845 [Bacteroidota bacterium]